MKNSVKVEYMEKNIKSDADLYYRLIKKVIKDKLDITITSTNIFTVNIVILITSIIFISAILIESGRTDISYNGYNYYILAIELIYIPTINIIIFFQVNKNVYRLFYIM